MSANATPGRREKGKTQNRTTFFPRFIAVVLILLAFVGFLLYLLQPVTFTYRGMTMEAVPGVAVNRYDPDGFYTDEKGRVQYTSKGASARAGIDVSYSQGDIDWPAVAADGVDFAIIRLGYRGYTQGAIQTDSCFFQNIQGALDAGLDVGVYFFSQAITPEEARQEADYTLSLLESYPITCPVVYDWEPITFAEGARTDQLEHEVLTQCAAAFCQRVAQAGYTPAVYFNQEMGYFSFDLKELSPFQFWLAEYDSYPSFYYGFTLWQYTHEGRVDGIQTPVDWNLDFSQLKR